MVSFFESSKYGRSHVLIPNPNDKATGNFGVLAPKTEILAILASAGVLSCFVLSHERKNEEEKSHERKNEGNVTQITQI